MTTEIAGYAAGVLGLLAFIPYVRATLTGRSKPERASWLIWTIADITIISSLLAKGATDSLLLTIAFGLGDLTIFLLSFKYGYGGKFLKRDYIGLAGVVLALLLWYLTNEPAVAVFLIIIIDSIGAGLTVIKSYEDPKSENMTRWVLDCFASILACVAVGQLDWVLLAFPLYVLLESIVIVGTIYVSPNRNKG